MTLLEELRAAGADVDRLLAWLVRLLAVAAIYSLGLAGLRAWKHSADATGEPFAPRALSVAWPLVCTAVALALTAASLGLESAGPLYRWGEDIAQWLSARVVTIVGTLAVAYVALALVRLLVNRLTAGGAFSRRQVRVDTLRGVLASVVRILVVLAAATTILSEIGVNVTALLAGVSILGLAVSFGAQSLVKDVITGFFILLEDQYGVGDVVRINGPTGLAGGVEAVSLRTTVLRDLEGTAHIVPNGTIQTVSVLSKDWARSVLDVEVAYGHDVDEAIELIGRVAADLHADEAWSPRFLEPPEVLGVETLGANGVKIRTLMKVQPKEQWPVGREFRRRIKNAFDRSGLEIPFPQLSLHLGKSALALATGQAAATPGDLDPDDDADREDDALPGGTG